MKKQFDKKIQNPQRLKQEYNIQLEAKNIQLKQSLKKLHQKRYRSFEIIKNTRQGAFQLKLPEEWVIYNIFNKNLLI